MIYFHFRLSYIVYWLVGANFSYSQICWRIIVVLLVSSNTITPKKSPFSSGPSVYIHIDGLKFFVHSGKVPLYLSFFAIKLLGEKKKVVTLVNTIQPISAKPSTGSSWLDFGNLFLVTYPFLAFAIVSCFEIFLLSILVPQPKLSHN